MKLFGRGNELRGKVVESSEGLFFTLEHVGFNIRTGNCGYAIALYHRSVQIIIPWG